MFLNSVRTKVQHGRMFNTYQTSNLLGSLTAQVQTSRSGAIVVFFTLIAHYWLVPGMYSRVLL